ncbi:hypothetical protein SLLC_00345 [Streptomyces lavendulae subsp. lavendulae]|nr:hypothetical protein SLLC_00345 [Streptomyces lavendulae subsp. lavendulae]
MRSSPPPSIRVRRQAAGSPPISLATASRPGAEPAHQPVPGTVARSPAPAGSTASAVRRARGGPQQCRGAQRDGESRRVRGTDLPGEPLGLAGVLLRRVETARPLVEDRQPEQLVDRDVLVRAPARGRQAPREVAAGVGEPLHEQFGTAQQGQHLGGASGHGVGRGPRRRLRRARVAAAGSAAAGSACSACRARTADPAPRASSRPRARWWASCRRPGFIRWCRRCPSTGWRKTRVPAGGPERIRSAPARAPRAAAVRSPGYPATCAASPGRKGSPRTAAAASTSAQSPGRASSSASTGAAARSSGPAASDRAGHWPGSWPAASRTRRARGLPREPVASCSAVPRPAREAMAAASSGAGSTRTRCPVCEASSRAASRAGGVCRGRRAKARTSGCAAQSSARASSSRAEAGSAWWRSSSTSTLPRPPSRRAQPSSRARTSS